MTEYRVYADDGDLSQNNFAYIGSTSNLVYTLDNTILTQFITGDKYRFKITAVNEIGEGEDSNEVRIALGSLPSKPSTP